VTSNNILYLNLENEPSVDFGIDLQRAGIDLKEVHTQHEAREELSTNSYLLFVISTDTVTETLFSFLQLKRGKKILAKFILSPQKGSIDEAIKCIKLGFDDYIIRDHSSVKLVEYLIKTITNYESHNSDTTVSESSKFVENGSVLIGQSQVMCEIRSAVNLIAKSQATVLLTGESGTGKEVIAQLIHSQSNRSNKPFIALNCATLPKDIIENELFGHEKGAFTGAIQKKIGSFELANGGTLLFDEIAEMSLETQAKLLRAIETHKFRRLGGNEEVCVDVRMIAATNKPILTALKLKELREDLYYRLSVIEIYIPPLRERKEDIPSLVNYFLSIFGKKYEKTSQEFSEESLEYLHGYSWPGNIRELRNVVERALVVCRDKIIEPHYLPTKISEATSTCKQINIPLGCSVQDAEKIIILQTLASTGNNKAKAARILGVSRKTLHNKLVSFQQKED
jgi:DNA-binding NtrC family response regulator